MSVRRGDVYWVNLDPTVGREMRKTRPCVIVQRDSANRTSPTVIVCPLTDAGGIEGNLLNVFVPAGAGGSTKDSLIVCNAIRSVDRARVGEYLGTLPEAVMSAVDRGLRAILDV